MVLKWALVSNNVNDESYDIGSLIVVWNISHKDTICIHFSVEFIDIAIKVLFYISFQTDSSCHTMQWGGLGCTKNFNVEYFFVTVLQIFVSSLH